MSQQGPILVVSSGQKLSFATALAETKMFPMIDATWTEASQAIARLQPAAVLAAGSDDVERVDVVGARLSHLAGQVAAQQPYVPLLVIDPKPRLPVNAISFSQTGGGIERLSARLRAALRAGPCTPQCRGGNPRTSPGRATIGIDRLDDATVLLIGSTTSIPTEKICTASHSASIGCMGSAT